VSESNSARLDASKEWLQAWRAQQQRMPASPFLPLPGTARKIKSSDDDLITLEATARNKGKAVSAELSNQIEDRALGADGRALLDIINACSDVNHLDEAARLLWKGCGEGAISDGESMILVAAIERRRPLGRRTAPGHATQVGRVAGRVLSRFLPRQRQRSPDRRASRDRRRMLGGSSALPDNLRHHFTEGQRAVLCVLAGEIKRRGVCDLPIDKIAALAGVCRTTTQTTMHEARRLGIIKITERPVPGRKSLPNLVEITSREWTTWIKRAPSASRLIGSNPAKMVSTTKIIDLRKEGERRKKDPNLRLSRPPPAGYPELADVI
jgi:hypothetical protein